MKDFANLTRRGKARRLRALALAALERYDLDVARVRLMVNMFNCTFRLDTADGEKYVLRINLPELRATQEIRSEAMWLAALRRELKLNVPEPLPNRDGDLVTLAEVPGVPETRRCVVFSWIPGTNLANHLSAENMEKLGILMARLHEHAATFEPPDGFGLKRFDQVFPFNEPFVLFDAVTDAYFEKADRVLFRYALDKIQAALDRLLANGDTMRVLHADLHQWNVKVHRGELYALDFDDMLYGYPVQDVAIALFYFQDLEHYALYRAAFRRGYERVRAWPEAFPGEIDTWIVQRGLDLLNFLAQSNVPEDREEVPYLLDRVQDSMEIVKEHVHTGVLPLNTDIEEREP